jgi:hypothetical protein
VPKYCKGKCGRKLSYQNKTGYCKECFGRFILSPKGANASRRDASKGVMQLALKTDTAVKTAHTNGYHGIPIH